MQKTPEYDPVLGQITSIYRHTKTIYRNLRDRIQAFFGQRKDVLFLLFMEFKTRSENNQIQRRYLDYPSRRKTLEQRCMDVVTTSKC